MCGVNLADLACGAQRVAVRLGSRRRFSAAGVEGGDNSGGRVSVWLNFVRGGRAVESASSQASPSQAKRQVPTRQSDFAAIRYRRPACLPLVWMYRTVLAWRVW